MLPAFAALGSESALFWMAALLAVAFAPVVTFLVAPLPFVGCVLPSLSLEVLGVGSVPLTTWLTTCGPASRPRAVVVIALLPRAAFALPLPACEVVEIVLPPFVAVWGLGLLPPVKPEAALPPPVAVGLVLLPSEFEVAVAPEPELALADATSADAAVGAAPMAEVGAWAGACG
jgi:hypothetical protein